jgi:hypothetical protein
VAGSSGNRPVLGASSTSGPSPASGTTTSADLSATAAASATTGPPTALDAWSQIKRAFDQAEPIAASPAGSYPFDAAGKAALLKDLLTAGERVDELLKEKRIDAATAELLRDDLSYLRSAVNELRAKPGPGQLEASCYEPMPMPSRAPSLDRLERRLPLVSRMLTTARLDPDVVRKVIARLEAEVADAEAWSAAHAAKGKNPANEKILADVRSRINALRARLPGGS